MGPRWPALTSIFAALSIVLFIMPLAAARHGQLRLVNRGGPAHHGLLQVKAWNRWGTICDDWFNHRAANVACREMGYPGGHFYGHGRCRRLHGRWVCGRGRIWLDNVRCRGHERRLIHCRHWHWGWHNCNHREDVVVICKPRPKWWIEWSFKDATEEMNWIQGSYIYMRMWFRKPQSAQAVHYCYGRHPRRQQFIVTLYANDDGTNKYDILKDYQVRWAHPWWGRHGYNFPSYGVLDILKRGVQCKDVVPWIRGVKCKGDMRNSEETTVMGEKIQCWQRQYKRTWTQDFNFGKLLQTEPAVVMSNTTISNTSLPEETDMGQWRFERDPLVPLVNIPASPLANSTELVSADGVGRSSGQSADGGLTVRAAEDWEPGHLIFTADGIDDKLATKFIQEYLADFLQHL